MIKLMLIWMSIKRRGRQNLEWLLTDVGISKQESKGLEPLVCFIRGE